MANYYGWTNYATWRVNLEIFDGMTARDLTGRAVFSVAELKDACADYAAELIEVTSNEGLARDYARAFLSDVDWWAIANHLIANNEDENESDYPDGVDDPHYVVTDCE